MKLEESCLALGSVLSQKDFKRKLVPVALCSRKLNGCTHEGQKDGSSERLSLTASFFYTFENLSWIARLLIQKKVLKDHESQRN